MKDPLCIYCPKCEGTGVCTTNYTIPCLPCHICYGTGQVFVTNKDAWLFTLNYLELINSENKQDA